jgi:hypothetical protein
MYIIILTINGLAVQRVSSVWVIYVFLKDVIRLWLFIVLTGHVETYRTRRLAFVIIYLCIIIIIIIIIIIQ